jgi:phosphatidate cytidylyltransferase
MLWYVLGVVEARPLANAAVSVMIYLWVAGLGSFSAVLLRQHQGKGLFLGVVLVAVAADIGAFAVGRAIGSRPMAADISPNKTIEGYIGGILAALIVGGVVGRIQPWGGIKHGLLLGLAIGIVAPLGDLFESMLKRDLNLKDSGGSLGGHGGLLDRFDAILLALPVGYFIALLLMHNSGHFRF